MEREVSASIAISRQSSYDSTSYGQRTEATTLYTHVTPYAATVATKDACSSRSTAHSVRSVLEDAERVKSFGDDSRLLRSMPFYEVLHTWGKILQNSKGSALTYELSQPCEHIDDFLSHNWSTPRFKKFMAWAMYCNFWTACLVAMSTLIITTMLTIFDKLVVVETAWGSTGVFGWALTLPTFCITVAVRHEVLRCLGIRGHTCFLDKTCIHQTDNVLKQKGIEKLGAFMNRSSRMVICYTDIYLNKLWTVYEVACFLLLCPSKRIIVIPTGLIRVMLTCLLFFYVGLGVEKLPTSMPKLIAYSVAFPPSMYILELWNQQQHRIRERVSTFTIANALCFCEDDRPLVLRKIVALIKFKRLVDVNASPKEALDVFDDLVRQFISKALLRHLGRWGMPYRFLCLMIFLTDFPASADAWAGEFHNHTIRERILSLLGSIVVRATSWPLTAAFFIWLLRQCMHLRGLLRWTYVFVICALSPGWMLTYYTFAHTKLVEKSVDSDLFLALFVFVYVSQFGLAFVVFRHHHHPYSEINEEIIRHTLSNRLCASPSDTTGSTSMNGSLSVVPALTIPQIIVCATDTNKSGATPVTPVNGLSPISYNREAHEFQEGVTHSVSVPQIGVPRDCGEKCPPETTDAIAARVSRLNQLSPSVTWVSPGVIRI